MIILSAQNKSELLRKLAEEDTSVPGPQKERNKKEGKWQIEKRLMYHVLATLAENGSLDYPIVVKKCESPDFLVSQNGRHFGFEVTESMRHDKAEMRSERQEDGTDDEPQFVNMRHEKRPDKEEKKRRKKIRQSGELDEAQKLTRYGYHGDEIEEEFVKFIEDSVNDKTAKLKNFTLYEENNLIIYHNQGHGGMDDDLAMKLLKNAIQDAYWNLSTDNELRFDNIYVWNADCLYICNKDGIKDVPMTRLWKEEHL